MCEYDLGLNSDQECRLPVITAIIDGQGQKLVRICLVFDTSRYLNYTQPVLAEKHSRGCCGQRMGCKQPNCGECPECQDLKYFGGPGAKKKACRKIRFTNREHSPKESKMSAITSIGKSNPANMKDI